MTRWAYLAEKNVSDETMTRLGEQGWELVAVVYGMNGWHYFFKRPSGEAVLR